MRRELASLKKFKKSDFENVAKDMSLSFLQDKDRSIENTSLPSFIRAFDSYMNCFHIIPTQDEFVWFYFSFFKQDLHGLENKSKAVEARARRAYPSIFRDEHLFAMLSESFDCHRSVVMDTNGIDCMVKLEKEDVFIHAFVNTKRSVSFRKQKDTRHDFKGRHVDFVLDPPPHKGTKVVNGMWLYSDYWKDVVGGLDNEA